MAWRNKIKTLLLLNKSDYKRYTSNSLKFHANLETFIVQGVSWKSDGYSVGPEIPYLKENEGPFLVAIARSSHFHSVPNFTPFY